MKDDDLAAEQSASAAGSTATPGRSGTAPGTDVPAVTISGAATAASESSAPTLTDTASAQPVMGPEPAPRVGTASAKHRSPLKTAWHRALARRAPDVQRCADQAAGSLERLALAVNIDTTGRVFAHVEGAPNIPLSHCLNAAFKDTILTAPREPASLVHVFRLRVLPDP